METANACCVPEKKGKWGFAQLLGLSGLALLIGPAGIVLALLNLRHAARVKQAVWLLVLSLISLAMVALHFLGHHH